jgi:excisionase family DNA binding protein
MLTVSAVAQRLGLKEPTIRLWITQGRIAHVKLGRAVRIPEEEVTRLVRDNLKAASQGMSR